MLLRSALVQLIGAEHDARSRGVVVVVLGADLGVAEGGGGAVAVVASVPLRLLPHHHPGSLQLWPLLVGTRVIVRITANNLK